MPENKVSFPDPNKKKLLFRITQPHLKLSQTKICGSFSATKLSFGFWAQSNNIIYYGLLGLYIICILDKLDSFWSICKILWLINSQLIVFIPLLRIFHKLNENYTRLKILYLNLCSYCRL